jgi:hypothetical protein
MPTPITNVTKQLTYKTPNHQWSLSDSEGKTATVTYTGPDKIWVFVDNDTTKISPPFYTSKDDGDSIPVPPGMTRVMLSAEVQTDLKVMAMLQYYLVTEPVGYSETAVALPDGSTWLDRSPLFVTDIHEVDTVTYNLQTSTWNFGYRTSPVAWEDIINARNAKLTASDGRISPDMPDALKAQWVEYRAKLRNFPATMGRGTVNEIEAWKCQLPNPPVE